MTFLNNFFSNKLDSQFKELINGSLLAFILKILGAGLSFVLNIYIVRNLGAEVAGVYFLCLTIVTIITITSRFGLDNAVVKFIAANASANNWSQVKGIFTKSIYFILISTTILTILLNLLSPILTDHIFKKQELLEPLRVMSLKILPIALVMIISEAFRGLKKFGNSLTIQGILFPLFVLVGLHFFSFPKNINNIITIIIFASLANMLISFIMWFNSTPQLRGVKGHFETSILLKTSKPLFEITVLELVIMWTSIITLGIFASTSEIGIFNAAVKTATITKFILVPISTIVAPKFAELFYNNHLADLGKIAQKTSKLMIIASAPVLILIFLFPVQIMGLFGDAFKKGAIVLIILSIGQFVNVITGPVNFLLMMSSNEHLLKKNILFIAIYNIVLNMILVPKFGMLGAAIASASSIVLQNIISLLIVKLQLNFWMLSFAKK